jgi:hypothetical protein
VAARRPSGPLRAVPRFLLITVLGVVGSGIGVYTFVEQKVAASRPPPPMSGHLNIAVAQFAAFDSEGHPVALASTRGLADSVFRGLEPQFGPLREAGFEVQIRAPRATGKVDGQSPERRAQQLKTFARSGDRIGARAGSMAA